MQCRNNMNKFWIQSSLQIFTYLYSISARWQFAETLLQHQQRDFLRWPPLPQGQSWAQALLPDLIPSTCRGSWSTQGWTHLNSIHFVTSFLRSGCVFLVIVWNFQHIKEEQAMWHCGIFSGRITVTWCIEPFKLEWLQHPTRLSTWIIDVWPSQ